MYTQQQQQSQGLMETYLRSLDQAAPPQSMYGGQFNQTHRNDMSRIDQNQEMLTQYMNQMSLNQPPMAKSGPVGTFRPSQLQEQQLPTRKKNLMLGDAIIKKSKQEEEPDKVRANGGYNGFKTAKDLLKIDFADKESLSDSEEGAEQKPQYAHPVAANYSTRRAHSAGYGKTMNGFYEDPEIYLRSGRNFPLTATQVGANPYRYGHYAPGPYSGYDQFGYPGYSQMGQYQDMNPYFQQQQSFYGNPMQSQFQQPTQRNMMDDYYNRFDPGANMMGTQQFDHMSRVGTIMGTARGGMQSSMGQYQPMPPQVTNRLPPNPYQFSGMQTPYDQFQPQMNQFNQPQFNQNSFMQQQTQQFPPTQMSGFNGPPTQMGQQRGIYGPQDDFPEFDSASQMQQRGVNDQIRQLEDKQNHILSIMKQREAQKSGMLFMNPLHQRPSFGQQQPPSQMDQYAQPPSQMAQFGPRPQFGMPPQEPQQPAMYSGMQGQPSAQNQLNTMASSYNYQPSQSIPPAQSIQQPFPPNQFQGNQQVQPQTQQFAPPQQMQGQPPMSQMGIQQSQQFRAVSQQFQQPTYMQSQVNPPYQRSPTPMETYGGSGDEQWVTNLLNKSYQKGQMPNHSPQPERPKSSIQISKNVKMNTTADPQAITKANGGYNGFNTAKDLLQMNFKDAESDVSDATTQQNFQKPQQRYQPSLAPIAQSPSPYQQNPPKQMFHSGPILPQTQTPDQYMYAQQQPGPTPFAAQGYGQQNPTQSFVGVPRNNSTQQGFYSQQVRY